MLALPYTFDQVRGLQTVQFRDGDARLVDVASQRKLTK
jgi:hypothetical protein